MHIKIYVSGLDINPNRSRYKGDPEKKTQFSLYDKYNFFGLMCYGNFHVLIGMGLRYAHCDLRSQLPNNGLLELPVSKSYTS